MPYRDREQQRASVQSGGPRIRSGCDATGAQRSCIARCRRGGFRPRVAERHEFTQDELRPVVGRMLALYGLDHPHVTPSAMTVVTR